MDSNSNTNSGNKLGVTDKVFSIMANVITIIASTIAYITSSPYLNLIIIMAIMIMVVTLIYLIVKTSRQKKLIADLTTRDDIKSKQIADLTAKDEITKEQISELQERTEQIPMMERLMNIPRFKKQRLYYTNIWRNSISQLKNQVNLSQIRVIRRVVGEGSGLWRDNNATYIFEGRCLCDLDKFTFSIAGREEVSISDINLKIIDLEGKNMDYRLFDSDDDNIKFLEIYFRKTKYQGDHFKIQITWIWPETVHLEYGYFSIPNIYSVSTSKLILEFIPSDEMNVNVDTYKYGLNDTEPQHVAHVYADDDKKFISIIENPEMNADYITYYE